MKVVTSTLLPRLLGRSRLQQFDGDLARVAPGSVDEAVVADDVTLGHFAEVHLSELTLTELLERAQTRARELGDADVEVVLPQKLDVARHAVVTGAREALQRRHAPCSRVNAARVQVLARREGGVGVGDVGDERARARDDCSEGAAREVGDGVVARVRGV